MQQLTTTQHNTPQYNNFFSYRYELFCLLTCPAAEFADLPVLHVLAPVLTVLQLPVLSVAGPPVFVADTCPGAAWGSDMVRWPSLPESKYHSIVTTISLLKLSSCLPSGLKTILPRP